jgi:hypothetical protein
MQINQWNIRQRIHRMQSICFLQSIMAIAVGLCLTGCFREVVRDPNSLAKENNRDIVVTTRDGNRYSFSQGSYVATVDTLGREVLQGEGKQYHLNSAETVAFQGSIPLVTVEKVTVMQTTPWLFISIGTLLLIVGTGLWLGPQIKMG